MIFLAFVNLLRIFTNNVVSLPLISYQIDNGTKTIPQTF